MKTRRFFPAVIIILILFLFSCGGSNYDTNYPPPESEALPDDVYPVKIADFDRVPIALMKIGEENFKGTRAVYGEEDIVIEIISVRNDADYNIYIDKYLIPEIDKYSNHARGSFNGKWSGSGEDETHKLYAWHNKDHIYKIKARIELFDEVINEFNFISAE